MGGTIITSTFRKHTHIVHLDVHCAAILANKDTASRHPEVHGHPEFHGHRCDVNALLVWGGGTFLVLNLTAAGVMLK